MKFFKNIITQKVQFMKNLNTPIRVLIVEDNIERIDIFKVWFPSDIWIVWVDSAGKAIGILRRDKGDVYAGIMLDHDLTERTTTNADLKLCGRHVVDEIIRCVSKHIPVLVHSENHDFSPVMVKKLEAYKFSVTRIPMSRLTREKLNMWIDDVRDIWEDFSDID